jgi:hypothetical protein
MFFAIFKDGVWNNKNTLQTWHIISSTFRWGTCWTASGFVLSAGQVVPVPGRVAFGRAGFLLDREAAQRPEAVESVESRLMMTALRG